MKTPATSAAQLLIVFVTVDSDELHITPLHPGYHACYVCDRSPCDLGAATDWRDPLGVIRLNQCKHTYARSVRAVAYRGKLPYSLSLYRYIYQRLRKIINQPSRSP